MDTNTLPAGIPAPSGSRWARIAGPGTWTPAARAVHAAEIAEWAETATATGSWGPAPAAGVGACVLAADDPPGVHTVGPLKGPATTYGGRSLWIGRDGSVWGAVALRRPSVFAGEGFRLPLSGAFRLEIVADNGVRDCDSTSRYPVRLVGPAGAVPAARIAADPALRRALARVGWTDPGVLSDGRIHWVP